MFSPYAIFPCRSHRRSLPRAPVGRFVRFSLLMCLTLSNFRVHHGMHRGTGGIFGQRSFFQGICFHGSDDYCPCGNVCELCAVFIWRAPRSSRLSRDLEKMLSRLLGFRFGAVSVEVGRSWCSVPGKTGVCTDSTGLVIDASKDCMGVRKKVLRSSASSQSNVVFVSGFSLSSGAVVHEVSALFRILHQAAGFHFIRPGFDFSRRSSPCRWPAARRQPLHNLSKLERRF